MAYALTSYDKLFFSPPGKSLIFFVAPKAHFRRLQSDPVLGFLSVRYTYIHPYIQLLLCLLGEWLGLVHALWRSRIETLAARASPGSDSVTVIRGPVLGTQDRVSAQPGSVVGGPQSWCGDAAFPGFSPRPSAPPCPAGMDLV